jgi:hypothetical protein
MFAVRLPLAAIARCFAAMLVATGLCGCAQLPLPKTAAAPSIPRPNAKPDPVLTCRMLKASYCAYDVSTRTYDAATQSARLERCESRAELQQAPTLAQSTTPPPFAYLSPAGTNAFLILQTSRDEIVIAFRGTIGLGAGLSGYFDWLNNFQAARFSDPLLGNVHFGFHNAMFDRQTSNNVWEALWQAMLRLRAQNVLDGKKIYVTGHSKGGVLALFAAARLKKEFGIEADAVYLFESPRAGTVDFARRYGELGIPTFRFENRGDIIPHMPPEADETEILAALGLPALTVSWWDPYVAVGVLGYVDWNGTLQFPEESAEFRAKRSHEFIDHVIAGDPRGVLSEGVRARLQFNHRILPGAPSYFDALCGSKTAP